MLLRDLVIDNNLELLRQALTDSDETVRQIAEATLEVSNKPDEEQKNSF